MIIDEEGKGLLASDDVTKIQTNFNRFSGFTHTFYQNLAERLIFK